MEQWKLSNGLRVLTIPRQDTNAVTVFVFAKVGSRYETKSTNGISHFIEHLMFKGTAKRPKAIMIARQLDAVGADYNAMTSKDWTGYYVKVSANHTRLALDVVSDILLNSKFDPKEIERERGAILEEINMYEDNPVMGIEDVAESAILGEHHPLGWNIAGPRSVIRTVNRATLLKYRAAHYHAKNMLVVVAGKILPETKTEIKKFFGALPSKPRGTKAKAYRPQATDVVRIRYKETEQVQIGLGVRGLKYTDGDMPALQLMSNILGGGMSSRLFTEVRERRGLCYNIMSGSNPYEDTGVFLVEAGLDKTRLEAALKVILAELRRLRTTPVTAAELSRAKSNIRGRMTLQLEDSDAVASWYGRQALFYRTLKTPEEALKRIQAVTAKDIQRVAQKLLRPGNFHLGIIGPFKDPKPFAKLLRTS